MNRSDRTILFGKIVSTLILIYCGVTPALGSSCSYQTSADFCALDKVSILTDSEAKSFVFPAEQHSFVLRAANILQSPKTLFNHLSSEVEKLELIDGVVPELYLKNTLFKFSARNNQARRVIIDEEVESYSVMFLVIAHNQLRAVPENITKLTSLVDLYLNNNEIETVSMDVFRDLNDLELLSLFGNRITRVDTKVTLELPNLSILHLGSNYLKSLSVEFWNLPYLEKMYLHNNKLRMISSFPEKFPNLKETSLGSNRWNCTWLDQTVKVLSSVNKIFIHKDDEACPEKSVSGICCANSLEEVRNSLVKSMTSQFQQMSDMLERAIQQVDGKISKLATDTSKVIEDKLSEVNRTVEAIQEEVKSVESKINANAIEHRKQVEKTIDELKTDTDRKFQDIRKEIKAVETNAKNLVLSEVQGINARVNANQALLVEDRKKFQIIEEEQKQLDSTLVEFKSYTDQNLETIKEQVLNDIHKTNVKVIEHQAQLEKTIGVVKSALTEQLGNARNQINDEFKWVKEKVNRNRALIDDVVEDLYMEKQEL